MLGRRVNEGIPGAFVVKRWAKPLVAILAVSFAFGCALPTIPTPVDPANPIKRVAILPMKNDTNDVEAPDFVRGKLIEAFSKRQYNVMPVEDVDMLLRNRLGVTLGGQLEMARIEDLRHILGVEGVVFGTLMDFAEVTSGVYNVKKVRAKFRLVNTITGGTFWEGGIGVKSEVKMAGLAGGLTSLAAKVADARDKDVPWVTIGTETSDRGFGETLAIGLGTKLLSKALGRHLERETNEMVRRVTQTLPWGPGTAAAPAVTPEPIAVHVPEVKMPEPPSFGYMDYGEADFSALVVYRAIDKAGKEIFSNKIPMSKAGKKIRMEMDFSEMTAGWQMPPALSKMVLILRGDKEVAYHLYPNKKRFMTVKEEEDEGYFVEPKVEKGRVGSETIDGHPTDKFRVKIEYRDGKIEEGYIWNAKDLEGMTIKSEVEDDNFRITTELRDVVLKTPPANLFEIPPGFTEVKGMMELMGEE